jgi:hypothetical protein
MLLGKTLSEAGTY